MYATLKIESSEGIGESNAIVTIQHESHKLHGRTDETGHIHFEPVTLDLYTIVVLDDRDVTTVIPNKRLLPSNFQQENKVLVVRLDTLETAWI